jgi:hypothetical protein
VEVSTRIAAGCGVGFGYIECSTYLSELILLHQHTKELQAMGVTRA